MNYKYNIKKMFLFKAITKSNIATRIDFNFLMEETNGSLFQVIKDYTPELYVAAVLITTVTKSVMGKQLLL